MAEIDLPETVNEFTRICRVCLNVSDAEYYSIEDFGKVCGKSVKISELLAECTSIQFGDDEHLPVSVCGECLLQSCKIYKFREMAFKSNLLLRQRMQRVGTKVKKAQNDELDAPIHVTSIDADTKEDNVSVMVDVIPQNAEVEEGLYDTITVILENDESIESMTEEIIQNTAEEIEHDGEYMTGDAEESTDEIPKMSVKKHRNRRRMKEGERRSLTCNVCNKTLSNFSSFKYHMQLHSEVTPFLCSECGEGFKTRNAYDGHMVTHETNPPNKCHICDKIYRQAASLRSHLLTHSGEKPFKCEICGKGMTQKSGYKKHMLTHTGELPYTCNICNKQFRYSSNLIMHKRSHIGQKNFECTECKKKFISKEQLKRHITIHTGQKPYKCTSCDKCFNRRSTLTIHQKIHEKRFKCNSCAERFDTKNALAEHKITHTEENSSTDNQFR